MDADKALILTTAYNAHKNELMYRRRMEYITASFGVAMYTTFIIMVLYSPSFQTLFKSGVHKGLATGVLILIADIQCYFFIKNYKRHCELQRAVCSIDHAFGFFLSGEYIEDEPLYEPDWKKSGTERSWGVISRCFVVFVFAGLLIITIWVKGWV